MRIIISLSNDPVKRTGSVQYDIETQEEFDAINNVQYHIEAIKNGLEEHLNKKPDVKD